MSQTRLSLQLRDDANTRVAAYESLLDLFTLITFVLIIAALIYATRVSGYGEKWSSVVTEVAQQGSGVPERLPKNAMLIVIYRENSSDKLAIVNGASSTADQQTVTPQGVYKVLDGFSSALDHVDTINVALYKGKEGVNADVYLAVTSWLALHGRNYYFVAE